MKRRLPIGNREEAEASLEIIKEKIRIYHEKKLERQRRKALRAEEESQAQA